MLERLLIQNFQAHEKLRVDFDPAITSIVGPSDVGKSAIIRALRWVCTNQPGGDAFVRHGSPGTTVKLIVDGQTVARRRSPGGEINEYHLGDKVYKAFGRDVPEPIQKFLNLGVVSWQGQHDAPYWFADTAGEVSRQLNAIVNLGIIDETLAGTARAVNKARTRIEVSEEDLTKAKQECDALAWVPRFTDALAGIEAAADRFEEARDKAAVVASTVEAVKRHQTAYKTAHNAATAGHKAVSAGAAALEAQDRAQLCRKLAGAAKKYEEIAGIDVPGTEALDSTFSRWREAENRRKPLQDLIESIRDKEAELWQLEKALKKAEAEVPTTCPTCGQSL